MENKEKKELSLAASGIIGYCLIIAGSILSMVTIGILLDISKWFMLLSIFGCIISLVGSYFTFSLVDECGKLDSPEDFGCLMLGTLSFIMVAVIGLINSFAIVSIFQ